MKYYVYVVLYARHSIHWWMDVCLRAMSEWAIFQLLHRCRCWMKAKWASNWMYYFRFCIWRFVSTLCSGHMFFTQQIFIEASSMVCVMKKTCEQSVLLCVLKSYRMQRVIYEPIISFRSRTKNVVVKTHNFRKTGPMWLLALRHRGQWQVLYASWPWNNLLHK